jgi:hypothetical protein
MRNREKGFSSLTLLIAIGFILVLVSAGSFYYLKFQGKISSSTFPFMQVKVTPSPIPASGGVSTSTDLTVIEEELDGTEIDSTDEDLEELESSASVL